MPCVVCQHCHGLLSNEEIAVRDGYSYHKKCHKCYVCSETNLKDAEVFKGVIFCYSCSQRIFQGCSSARKSKNGNRKAEAVPRVKRRNKSKQKRRQDITRHRHVSGVLEMTRLAAFSDSESSSTAKNPKKLINSIALTKPIQEIDQMIYDASKKLNKSSAEIGVTTEVTQDLLRQMNCPVVSDTKFETRTPVPAKTPREKGDSHYNKTIICSDLRIAELGASTEIAHMALRKKSELPVILRSENRVKEYGSFINSPDSDASEYDEDFDESNYSLNVRDPLCWLSSVIKYPYRFFKNTVLNRSSLISIAIRNDSRAHETICDLLSKIRLFFHEEITEHQSRGIKRLYSTINRRRIPYKLGWLKLVAKVSEVIKSLFAGLYLKIFAKEPLSIRPKPNTSLKLWSPAVTIRQRIKEPNRCKHFNRSHSYRCMRAQAMKQAGPTKSELEVFRNKLKNLLIPPILIKNAICYTKKINSVKSEACGSASVNTKSILINCPKI